MHVPFRFGRQIPAVLISFLLLEITIDSGITQCDPWRAAVVHQPLPKASRRMVANYHPRSFFHSLLGERLLYDTSPYAAR